MKFYYILLSACFFVIPLSAFTTLPETNLSQDSLSLEAYLKSQEIEAEITEEGLFYKIEKYGNGTTPNPGDYVMIKYKGMLLNGNVFDESDEDEPFVFQLGYRHVILGWEYGIPLFQVGSKGRLFVPAELAYGRNGAGTMVPPNAPLIFEIELVKIMTFEEYDKHMVNMEKKAKKKFEAKKKAQFTADKKLIQEYLISHKIKKSKRLPSGVSYVITKKGKGENAKPGDFIDVHYSGYLVDDSMFDSSEGKASYKFQLGKGKVIDGWDVGLQQFNKGSEGWLLIPSQDAYGPRPIEEDGISIPGNSVLIFKIKVLDVSKN